MQQRKMHSKCVKTLSAVRFHHPHMKSLFFASLSACLYTRVHKSQEKGTTMNLPAYGMKTSSPRNIQQTLGIRTELAKPISTSKGHIVVFIKGAK